MQLPIGKEENFVGVIDLVEMKGIVWDDESLGAQFEVTDIPADLLADAEAAREQLIEEICSHDDELMGKYLSGEGLDDCRAQGRHSKGTIDISDQSRYLRIRLQKQRGPASAGCSDRLSCLRPSTCPRSVGIDPDTEKEVSRHPSTTALCRTGLQGHDRPLCRAVAFSGSTPA
jgi:elongation factor G